MTPDLAQAYRACARLTRERARNFYYAFLSLPADKRRAIYALYAFCRRVDDVTDDAEIGDPAQALQAYRRQVAEALAGRPPDPMFAALQDTVERYAIPGRHFEELIQGMEMDLSPRPYRNFEELRVYCYRAAATVGLMCLEVFGYRDPRAREAAIDLGTAMQLTNILRDVREDAERGRIYLPRDEMARFAYSEKDLHGFTLNEPFRRLMRFQVNRARHYFAGGRRLLGFLSRRSRLCPAILHATYSRILDRIEACGYDVFSRRIEPRRRDKILLLMKVWTTGVFLPSRGTP